MSEHAASMAPSSKAESIIRNLRIRHPSEIHIEDIAMERGAYVRERYLHGSEGRLVRRGNRGIITVNKNILEGGRKRFVIAHELGHFELHTKSQLILCSEQDMLFWNESKTEEIEANDFAASVLMPKSLFELYLEGDPPNMDTVKRIASDFDTTLTATSIRFVQISAEPCAVVVCRDGHIKWYKKSRSFDYHIKVGEKLSPNTYAFDFYDGVELPIKSQKAPAYPWIAGNVDGEAEIYEHSVSLPQYNVVLSLLWIYDEIKITYERDDEDPEFDLTSPFTPDGKRWRW